MTTEKAVFRKARQCLQMVIWLPITYREIRIYVTIHGTTEDKSDRTRIALCSWAWFLN